MGGQSSVVFVERGGTPAGLERLELVLKALPDEGAAERVGGASGTGEGRRPDPGDVAGADCGDRLASMCRWSRCHLRELRRNPALLGRVRVRSDGTAEPRRKRTAGVGAPRAEGGAPKGGGVHRRWNFTRFLSSVVRLEEERGLIAVMTGRLREQLMEEVEDFGEHLGYDGKGLRSHSTGRRLLAEDGAILASGGGLGPARDEREGRPDQIGGCGGRSGGSATGSHLIAVLRDSGRLASDARAFGQVKELEAMSEALFREAPQAGLKRCQELQCTAASTAGR